MNKLRRIRSPWHRLFISLFVSCLSFLNLFVPKRARVHWVGGPRRSRRLERVIIVLLFAAAMLLLQARDYALWSVFFGGTTSIYLTLYGIYQMVPRKQAHWV